MWLHGSALHLTSNLATRIPLWWLARHCFRGIEWLWLRVISGVVAGPIQLLVEPARHPDVAAWPGALAGDLGQAHSPLVGASGGTSGLRGRRAPSP